MAGTEARDGVLVPPADRVAHALAADQRAAQTHLHAAEVMSGVTRQAATGLITIALAPS